MSETSATTTQATQPLALRRVRLVYARGNGLRYISHLEMQLVWERTFRRARLPIAYSQGFNPHPRLHLASALPLGFLSQCEIADVWLEKNEDLEAHGSLPEIQERVQRSSPPGLTVLTAEDISLQEAALQTQVSSAEYLATPLDPLNAAELRTRVEALLAAEHLPRERRGKAYDLRTLIEGMEVRGEGDQAQIWMRLTALASATGRPEEALDELKLDPAAFRVERLAIHLIK